MDMELLCRGMIPIANTIIIIDPEVGCDMYVRRRWYVWRKDVSRIRSSRHSFANIDVQTESSMGVSLELFSSFFHMSLTRWPGSFLLVSCYNIFLYFFLYLFNHYVVFVMCASLKYIEIAVIIWIRSRIWSHHISAVDDFLKLTKYFFHVTKS